MCEDACVAALQHVGHLGLHLHLFITYEEMNTCVVRLACRQCATYARQEIFDWKGAVRSKVTSFDESLLTILNNHSSLMTGIGIEI